MGGASTQLSFITSEGAEHLHPTEIFKMNLFNTDYSIYSHIYLCYGQDQLKLEFRRQLIANSSSLTTTINDPCMQPHSIDANISYTKLYSTPCSSDNYNSSSTTTLFTFVGTNNSNHSQECRQHLRNLFNKTLCTQNSTCSFNNTYQPVPISSQIKFIAISAWYTTFDTLAPYLNVTKSTIYSFEKLTLEKIFSTIFSICDAEWSPSPTNPFRQYLCFDSMYHWTLLEYGYEMTNDNLKKFQIVQKLNDNEIGWALGYMINQTNFIDKELRPARLLTKAEFAGLFAMCLFLLMIGIIFFVVLFRRRRQNQPFTNPIINNQFK